MRSSSPDDERWLERALSAAAAGVGHTRPNPPVGAVIVRNGKLLGVGCHKKAGGDHAEVAAIKDAKRRGNEIKGATIYVTLEPCSKAGRVGACTDAIREAGLKRVVYGSVDPNPVNRGRARKVLAEVGIECAQTKSQLAIAACDERVKAFRKHVTTGLPYVTVKIAMSLDGKICDDWGEARWVSSEKARKTTGRLREQVDAIMVGAETVRKDNPSLLSHGKRNDDLVRVVVSKSGKLPRKAQVFTDGKNQTLVFDDAKKALVELGKMGMMHVLCEGGMKLAVSLAEAGLVDEWVTVLAPKVIGTRRISKATKIGEVTCLQDF